MLDRVNKCRDLDLGDNLLKKLILELLLQEVIPQGSCEATFLSAARHKNEAQPSRIVT